MSTQPQASQSREVDFVAYLCQRCQKDKGFAARLRRADNPTTEYQSWDTLAAFGINLECAEERQPFALIAAAVARSDQACNGALPLGQAIALAFSEGRESDQAKARLRRLLACDDTEEVCRILRPLLTLIRSRVKQPLDYAALLVDLRWFHRSADRAKARWAQQFYGWQEKEMTA
ncbi:MULTISPECIES: type I-E CRISPR-associated protein Cse2/CasB [Aeromonas]|uniref:type I-E CRISPR-associated protein Cse2/CasB n=1 Tax=Aeromonas TaxID=642 RepID=UPI001C5B9E53|nr:MULTISPECIES: type I-E CRISPR-associated protein Cse2/CasB [Aeromonas]MBW3798305.1 type I-E CRISPR-associated protein Cse2/CasB [Aeromonas hydrophila]MBW3799659.1 type I-E CRISPR-associated protein Cse2/CasB [Aeromonas hydrophila]MBW3821026.1 type I-E CRISPR-associated protein Cse2/CasB [Aeromonas hydrophila]MCC0087452.1 type I-E CRISPR-associated protein Cse2/CasB [Aeromonas veronii]MCP3287137.1 type I-E CRISPR-associated protein Cse2/CasB [Aeromonas hydrophila]